MRTFRCLLASITAGLLLAALAGPGAGQDRPPVVGRWDLTVRGPNGDYPSWLEVTEKDGQLTGRFTGRTGSPGPVKSVSFTGGTLVFTLPARRQVEPRYEARLQDGRLVGKTDGPQGRELTWEGRRAPELRRSGPPAWGEPLTLFNGRDLAGWRPRVAERRNGWAAQEDRLVNAMPGNDLVTQRTFTDFRLHAEFRYPKGSNSGIYLRGRYELQIEDSFGQAPESHGLGAIYGFLAPRVNAARPAGEWQACDVTLVGRMLTVVLNGQKIIDEQEIPGITGGALDSDEGAPGPIFLQGDHGQIEFRNLQLTPTRDAAGTGAG